MEENVYTPPVAALEVEASTDAQFFVVAPWKLIVLGIGTLQLYLVYWFYQNWKAVKISRGDNLWPVPRSIFSIFFTHALFDEVKQSLGERELNFDWNPRRDATIYVILYLLANVVSGLSGLGDGWGTLQIAYLLVLVAIPCMFANTQRVMNIVSDDPEAHANNQLTLVNWLWLVFGGLLWLVQIVSAYVLLFDPELLT